MGTSYGNVKLKVHIYGLMGSQELVWIDLVNKVQDIDMDVSV